MSDARFWMSSRPRRRERWRANADLPVPGGPERHTENARACAATRRSARPAMILLRAHEQRIEIGNGAGFPRDRPRHRAHDAECGALDRFGAAARELRCLERVFVDRRRRIETPGERFGIGRGQREIHARRKPLQDALALDRGRALQLDGKRHAPQQRRIDVLQLIRRPDDRDRVGLEQAVEIDLRAATLDQMDGDVLHLIEQYARCASGCRAGAAKT